MSRDFTTEDIIAFSYSLVRYTQNAAYLITEMGDRSKKAVTDYLNEVELYRENAEYFLSILIEDNPYNYHMKVGSDNLIEALSLLKKYTEIMIYNLNRGESEEYLKWYIDKIYMEDMGAKEDIETMQNFYQLIYDYYD